MSSETIVWPDLKSKVPRINLVLKQAFAKAEEQGHSEGFESGQKAGREAAEVELAELRDRYCEAVRKIDSTRLKVEQDQVRALADIVQGLCEKIIGMELSTSSALLEKVLDHAVDKLNTAPVAMEICINPGDRQWLDRHDLKVHINVDDSITEGTIVLQTVERSEEYKPLEVLEKAFQAVSDDLDRS